MLLANKEYLREKLSKTSLDEFLDEMARQFTEVYDIGEEDGFNRGWYAAMSHKESSKEATPVNNEDPVAWVEEDYIKGVKGALRTALWTLLEEEFLDLIEEKIDGAHIMGLRKGYSLGWGDAYEGRAYSNKAGTVK